MAAANKITSSTSLHPLLQPNLRSPKAKGGGAYKRPVPLTEQEEKAEDRMLTATHSLHRLKRDYNKVVDENTKFRTKNCQLEQLVTALSEDLRLQQQELNKFFQGKPPTQKFYEQTMV